MDKQNTRDKIEKDANINSYFATLLICLSVFWFVLFPIPDIKEYVVYAMLVLVIISFIFVFYKYSVPQYRFQFIPMVVLIIMMLFSIFSYDFISVSSNYYSYYGKLIEKKESDNSYYLVYECKAKDNNFIKTIEVSKEQYFDTTLIQAVILKDDGTVLKWGINQSLANKYTYGVLNFESVFSEIGNNTFDYARYEPNVVFSNYGFNIVFFAEKVDDNHLQVHFFNGIDKSIDINTDYNDDILVYCNINPDYFDGWHICDKSLISNLDKIKEDKYGYLFGGQIYFKDAVEEHWNIVEEYKKHIL